MGFWEQCFQAQGNAECWKAENECSLRRQKQACRQEQARGLWRTCVQAHAGERETKLNRLLPSQDYWASKIRQSLCLRRNATENSLLNAK